MDRYRIGLVFRLILVAGAVLFLIGNARLNKTYDFPPSDIVIPTDAESIAFGKHRAESLCQGCHGADLSGKEKWFNAGPLGTIDSANLTSGVGGFGREATSNKDYVRGGRFALPPFKSCVQIAPLGHFIVA